MTLDEFLDQRLRQRCAEYATSLETLASAVVNNKVTRDMDGLVNHLRALYRARRTAFTTHLVEKINRFAKPGSNSAVGEAFQESVEGPSSSFQVGKHYLSQSGVFRVIAVSPFPSITPRRYPKCGTPYFARYMLEEHNRLLAARTERERFVKRFAREFVVPQYTAEAEIAQLTEEYQLFVEAKHREFLAKNGMPYLGTQPTTEGARATHCYACKVELYSVLYKECRACGWLICSCGACGCGYAR